jgi:hypothetical protein
VCTVPDKRTHRGPHPQDAELFCDAALPRLRSATADLSWLLGRGYALPGALQVVGNRYALEARQRQAVTRCACGDEARDRRRAAEVRAEALAGATLLIDGYNVLPTVEAALGGAVVLHARDGTYRDIAGVHGTFRHVKETIQSLTRVGELAAEFGVARCVWFLDAPVSNSGRLKETIESLAARAGWAWEVRVVPDPDVDLAAPLTAAYQVIATADAGILSACGPWFSLAKTVISARVAGARIIDLCV